MLSIIVAVAENNVIGNNNKLIWKIPEDLKNFKKLTTGKTIIMGRKTFESLPFVLPNRKHIVLTRNADYKIDNIQVEVSNNLQDIVNKYRNEEEAFIIGGGDIYNKTINLVDKIYITKIFKNYIGDTYFPKIDKNEFCEIGKSDLIYSADEDVHFSYFEYIRIK